MSGVYTVGSDTGTFSATRELADPDAVWRYTGEWYVSSVKDRLQGLQVINVDANGEASGAGPQVVGNRYDTSGTVNGNQMTLSATSGSGTTVTGTIDEDFNASMTGTNSEGQPVLSFATGCRLN
jgi:hypothetical protein